MGKRSWTDDQLREAVASARCLADVMRALGIQQQRTIVARANELGPEIPVGKRTTWTDDDLLQSEIPHWNRRGCEPLASL